MPVAYNSFEDVVVVLNAEGENLLTLENVSRTEKDRLRCHTRRSILYHAAVR